MAQEQDIYKGHYLRVTEQEGDDGHIYERAHVRPGANAILITEALKLRFIREWNWSRKQERTKLVSGYVEDGESPLECIQRELSEELGSSAANWEFFLESLSDEGTVVKTQFIFIGFGVKPNGQPHPEPGERIMGYVDYTPSEVRAIVLQGGFGTGYQAFALLKFLENANMQQ